MGGPKNNQIGLNGLGQVQDVVNHRILRRDTRSDYTLDMDAMQVEAEKAEARFTYKAGKGYMPMIGYLFEPAVCLLDEFREGNESPAAGHKVKRPGGFQKNRRRKLQEGLWIFYRCS